MPRSRNAPDSGGRWTVARQVSQFTLAGIVAVVIVGLATAVASRRVGEREAIVDARTKTLAKAQGLVEPVVTNGLLTANPAAVQKVGTVVTRDVLDDQLIRVKIWNRDGTIVYSDEPQLIGSRYTLARDDLAALDAGVIKADVSDLSKPENRFERSYGKLLEVYLPIRAPNGQRLLFEGYFRYSAVSSSGARIWRSFAPISLGALVALELVQLPLAWSLARRLRQRQREREGLLQRAIDASDTERRHIAADIHDGVVQNLVGVAFTLGGAARRDDVQPETAQLLGESANEVRVSVKALRSLLVEIYPPNLFDEGLVPALTDLFARASGRGIVTTLDDEGLSGSPPAAVSGLLYRAAQEALRNVLAHAHATTVTMRVSDNDRIATLEVVDDGVGFDPAQLPSRAREGHFGLHGLTDLVADAGGRLTVESAPGAGTTVRVEVPFT
ncbi:MAG: two-component system, NarL family, sensor kinase [Actinomycetota bacterium]|nr:two-component system, NarL family, sensor kinase [Actinomycetota bacterium]